MMYFCTKGRCLRKKYFNKNSFSFSLHHNIANMIIAKVVRLDWLSVCSPTRKYSLELFWVALYSFYSRKHERSMHEFCCLGRGQKMNSLTLPCHHKYFIRHQTINLGGCLATCVSPWYPGATCTVKQYKTKAVGSEVVTWQESGTGFDAWPGSCLLICHFCVNASVFRGD